MSAADRMSKSTAAGANGSGARAAGANPSDAQAAGAHAAAAHPGGEHASGAPPHEAQAAAPPYPADLAEAAGELDLGAEQVFLAWELARMAGPRPEPEVRALATLVLALLGAQRDGSTRLRLARGGLLDAFLSDLALPDAEQARVVELAERLAAASLDPGLGRVVGTGEAYVPLLVEDGHLYAQRLLSLEARVAGLLRGRLSAAAEVRPVEPAHLDAALHDVQSRLPRFLAGGLAPEQEAAVRAAAEKGLTVITGGPGTGKTSIVVTLLRVLARLRGDAEHVALAAPTGKAADRMVQSIRRALQAVDDPADVDRRLAEHPPEAATLHRLLGYSPHADRFRHHENHPLPAEVVIVDESSMIDLSLMDRLLRAVRHDARLILLGDADQLPSVDAGAVFRDLCRAGLTAAAGARVRLSQSYRMDPRDPAGRAILQVAEHVREGKGEALFAEAAAGPEHAGRLPRGRSDPRSTPEPDADHSPPEPGIAAPAATLDPGALTLLAGADALPFEKVSLLEPADAAGRGAFLEAWEARRVLSLPDIDRRVRKAHRYFDGAFVGADAAELLELTRHLEASRILCVTRVEAGGTGTEAVNAWFHQRALDRARLGGGGHGAPAFAPGEPVMVTRNDYARGLFNGDQGLVVRGRLERAGPLHFLAVFPRADGFAAFPVEALRGRLELAWATTVHKSQGSEYDHVALILPDRDVRLLSREIVYTAVTRARRSVTILGDRERLVQAAGRPVERDSGLAARLG